LATAPTLSRALNQNSFLRIGSQQPLGVQPATESVVASFGPTVS
jgi:hypothetical protein